MKTTLRQVICFVVVMLGLFNPLWSDLLETNFAHPPDSARPWVYWFWSNGNITKEGITADLEAMKRVGIGGVLIMDVVETWAPFKSDTPLLKSGLIGPVELRVGR